MDRAEVQDTPKQRVRRPRKAHRRIGLMNRRDDGFFARGEPSAEPRGGGLGDGSSGYADGLRRANAGRGARREQPQRERRDAVQAAYVAAARVMGAAVVVAAAVAVLVFAGVVPSWPGASTGHRTETLERQSTGTTTPGSVPGTATPPSPSTTTEIEPPALPPSDPGAIRGTTARARTPARPSATQARNTTASSNSTGAKQLSAGSLLPPSGAPVPVTPMTPKTNPAGHAPPGRNK
jgi:hypothetical protein